jgi:serine/threonine protein kinase/WD40 repeat protein
MGKPSLERIEELFHQVADLDPQACETFLRAACGADTELLAAVNQLLHHDQELLAGDYLVSPIERAQAKTEPSPKSAVSGGLVRLPRPGPPGYELLEELGAGGMGIVFKARQQSLSRLVALKMLLAGVISADQAVRFRREVDALARLQHPNIVQIYEAGEYEGRPFLVMEYVPGLNLTRALAGRPQPPREAATLVAVLAEAMQAVHDRGIIHRDLKPANILLQIADCRLQIDKPTSSALGAGLLTPPTSSQSAICNLQSAIPKITDFGLAKRLGSGSGRTSAGMIVGTPSYMAPEQARGQNAALTPAVDIYALGSILYELLTGRPPFSGTSSEETIAQVCLEEPISPARLQAGLPPDLVTICLKCLEKEPSGRYARAADLAGDLRRFLDGRSILARPVSLPGRVWRWCRRRPLVAGLAASTTLLAVALVGTLVAYLSLLLQHSQQQLASAEQQAAEQGQLAEQERRQLSHMDRLLGAEELEHHEAYRALLWLTEALGRDGADPRREYEDRLEIGLILQQCPRPVLSRVWEHPVCGAQIGTGGSWVALSLPNGIVEIADVQSDSRRRLPTPMIPGPSQVHISGDGRLVVLMQSDGDCRIWDLEHPQHPPCRLSCGPSVRSALFSSDNRRLIIRFADERLQIWDLQREQPALVPVARLETARRSAVSNDGQWLFTLSPDNAGSVAPLAGGAAKPGSLGLRGQPLRVALRSDRRQVALVDEDRRLWIWEVDSGRLRQLGQALPTEVEVRELQWSDDGRFLLARDLRHAVRVWEIASGGLLIPALHHPAGLLAAGFVRNDQLVTVSADRRVHVWQLPHGPEPRSGDATASAGQTPPDKSDSRTVQLANQRLVRIPAFRTAARLRSPGLAQEAGEDSVMSHDRRRVATLESNHEVRIWDSTTGVQVAAALAHRVGVCYAAFSPDNRHLVTASTNRTAWLWDLSEDEPIGLPLHCAFDIERVLFDTAGKELTIVLKGNWQTRWQLTPEPGSLPVLQALGQALAAQRVGEQGSLLPLETQEASAAWQKLDAKKR